MQDITYKILRAPLVASFETPTQDELLKLKEGDLAKIIFQVKDDKPERMWVTLTDCSNPAEWLGKIESVATQVASLTILPKGKEVSFHPLDIVAIE